MAALPPDPIAGEYIPADSGAGGWAEVFREFHVADLVHHNVMPAWTIEDRIKEGASAAGAEWLEHLFPGGLGNVDSWGPAAKLGYFMLLAVAANFDISTMSLRPMREPAPAPASEKPKGEGSENGD